MIQRLLIIFHSRLQLIGVLVHGANIIVSRGESRLLIDSHLEITDGVVMALQITVHQTHVVILHSPGRCGTHGLFHIAHRVFIVSHAGLHFTQTISGGIVPGT